MKPAAWDSRGRALAAEFLQRRDRARTARLLLDYDGTLAPFQTERDKAYPYPQVVPLLDRIIRSGKTRVSIVSGRPVDEARSLLGPLRDLEIWGAHGLERLSAEGVYERADVAPAALSTLREAEDWLRQSGLRSLAEIKPGGIAVHWRGRTEAEAADILSCIQKGWSGFRAERSVRLLSFDGGMELRATHPDKGDVIKAILAETDKSAAIAFLGDDLTDEDAFRALGGRGLSILARTERRPTRASVWLRPPSELIEFLNLWMERLA